MKIENSRDLHPFATGSEQQEILDVLQMVNDAPTIDALYLQGQILTTYWARATELVAHYSKAKSEAVEGVGRLVQTNRDNGSPMKQDEIRLAKEAATAESEVHLEFWKGLESLLKHKLSFCITMISAMKTELQNANTAAQMQT